MMTYLLKASACVALFYFIYFIFLRHTNRHQLNRAFLMLGLILAFVIPVIVLPSSPIESVFTEGETVMDDVATSSIAKSVASTSFISYGYYSGAVISLLITVVSLLKVLRIYRSGEKLRHKQIVVQPGIQPFSFMGILFIRSEHEDPLIVEHEMVHIKQLHWIDLVMVEVASIVLWFNPIIHLYKRSITLQHEYIADNEVTKNISIDTYLECIAKQLESGLYSNLVNGFNTQSIKQRIIMITNTKNYSAARHLVVLPLIATLVMSFSAQDKAFRSPVDLTRVKSGEGAGYGMRYNPTANKEVLHTGVDFVLAAGENVYATSDGVIVSVASSDSYGNFVVIEHNKELRTSSSHLQSILVKAGDKVNAGDVIGTVGSTGLSKAPHLHFEVLKNGKPVDPTAYLNGKIE